MSHLIIKDKQTVFLTLINKNVDGDIFDIKDYIITSNELPKKGITFEFETLSVKDYTRTAFIAGKVGKEGLNTSEESMLNIFDYMSSKVVAIHNIQYNNIENFGFDTYFLLMLGLINASKLSDEEMDSFQ